jgi:membrane associated rhomboid family serine protease
MFANLPQVTKNILLLNIMFFIATLILESQGIDLVSQLGTHYINSPQFEPFQIITHFFMHANFFHILMNMWLFVMLGAYLENLWGPKRFFIFYIACALGSFALHNAIGVFQIFQLRENLVALQIPMDAVDSIIKNTDRSTLIEVLENYLNTNNYPINQDFNNYFKLCITPMVGASGAIFGVLAAFAILFPNTEFRLYFAIPIKAKYFVGAYLLLEIYQAIENNAGDSTAHLAHIGGAIVGGALVLIWRKTDRTNFY